MRRIAMLTALVSVAFGFAARAQLSLLPQVGFENSKTTINYNDLRTFSPMGVKFSPQVGVKLDYTFKCGTGLFAGINSSRSLVNYRFTNPETGMYNYTAVLGDMQVRLEGGLQYTSKPIFFNKSKQTASKTQKTTSKSGCGSSASRSSCCSKNTSSHCSPASKAKQAIAKNKGSWLRIQPSVGMAYNPSSKENVVIKTQGYEYRSGNWGTALITGAGFEFGKGNNRMFTISLNYYNAIGNRNTETFSSMSGTKSVITKVSSNSSAWGMKVGIPFSLSKKPASKQKKVVEKKQEGKGCGQQRIIYRCRF